MRIAVRVLAVAHLPLHRGPRFRFLSAVAVRPPLSLGRLQFPQLRELCSGDAVQELGNSLIFLGLAFLLSRLGPERCPVWTGDSQSPEDREAPLLAGRGTPGPLWLGAGHGERLPARVVLSLGCGRLRQGPGQDALQTSRVLRAVLLPGVLSCRLQLPRFLDAAPGFCGLGLGPQKLALARPAAVSAGLPSPVSHLPEVTVLSCLVPSDLQTYILPIAQSCPGVRLASAATGRGWKLSSPVRGLRTPLASRGRCV